MFANQVLNHMWRWFRSTLIVFLTISQSWEVVPQTSVCVRAHRVGSGNNTDTKSSRFWYMSDKEMIE